MLLCLLGTNLLPLPIVCLLLCSSRDKPWNLLLMYTASISCSLEGGGGELRGVVHSARRYLELYSVTQTTTVISTANTSMIRPQGMPMASPITSCAGAPDVVVMSANKKEALRV